MNVKSSRIGLTALGAIAMLSGLGTALAADDSNNPLHPSYYSNRASGPERIVSTPLSDRVADTRNPLHPSFYAWNVPEITFIGAAARAPAVDEIQRNPLHPAHRFR